MKISFLNKKTRMVTLQLICWGVILCITLFWGFGSSGNSFDSFAIAQLSINIVIFIIIYLLNYLIFIPQYLFRDNHRSFFLTNVALVALLLCSSYFENYFGLLDSLRPEDMPPRPHGGYLYLLRDLINFILMIGLVTAMRLAERLQEREKALSEAESARIKAELDNLRSQINPHFLLNTLNNIYALTAIDIEKAQKTIKELSNLLRYILYDNLNDRVSLKAEIEFIKTYIELMSIRLPRKVTINTQFNISEECTTQVAPLIFISLIENAFKHSVSAAGDGFIEIIFEDNNSGEITLMTKNSNFAKAEQDKSGHGIGLEQVHRRLELMYPTAHSWEVISDKDVYISKLTLKQQST